MWKQVGVCLRAALLLAVLNYVLAEDKYFAVGGKLALRPNPPAAISNILWKHKGNLLAEWVKGLVDLTYYNTFKGRTTLNTTTGLLEITNMGEADMGLYTVEINNVVQSPSYDVKVIKKVPQPEVVVRPVSCNGDSEECTLSCDGNTGGAEPVTYSWREGAGDWKESGKDIKIIKTETRHVETYSCKMKNPVSEKESKPEKNPFFEKTEPDGSGVGGKVAIGVVSLLILCGVGGVAYWKRDFIKEKFSKGDSQTKNDDSPMEAGAMLDQGTTSKTETESVQKA